MGYVLGDYVNRGRVMTKTKLKLTGNYCIINSDSRMCDKGFASQQARIQK